MPRARRVLSDDEPKRLEAEADARTRQALRRQRELSRSLAEELAQTPGAGGWTGGVLERTIGTAPVWHAAVVVRWLWRARSARPRPVLPTRSGLALLAARRRTHLLAWRLRWRRAPRRLALRLRPRERLQAHAAVRLALASRARGAPRGGRADVTWIVHGSRRDLLLDRVCRVIAADSAAVRVRRVRGGWERAAAEGRSHAGPVLVSRLVVGHRSGWLGDLLGALERDPSVHAVVPRIEHGGKVVGGGWRFALTDGVPHPVPAARAGPVPAVDGTCLLVRSGSMLPPRPPGEYATDLWGVDVSLSWSADGLRLEASDLAVEAVAPQTEEDLRTLLARHGPWLRRTVASDAIQATGFWAAGDLTVRERDRLAALLERGSLTIRIAARDAATARRGGDLALATALAEALGRAGHEAEVELSGQPPPLRAYCHDVCLDLRGRHPPARRPGQTHVMWIISHPEEVGDEELAGSDLVLVASRSHARRLAGRRRVPVRPLLQFTDLRSFYPDPDASARHELLFVGNWRSRLRPVVWAALRSGRDLALYGDGWDLVAPQAWRGRWVDTDALRRLYSSADIVLNDHWPDMRERGFLSNRLFDALACGAFLMSDAVEGLEEELGDAVQTFAGSEDFGREAEEWLSRPELRKERAERGRAVVRERHSSDARVRELLAILSDELPSWRPNYSAALRT